MAIKNARLLATYLIRLQIDDQGNLNCLFAKRTFLSNFDF